MPQFKIKKEESKVVEKATFNKKEDYMAVILDGQKTPKLLHRIQAEKLIKSKKAKEAKDVKVEELINERTKTVIDVDQPQTQITD